MTQFDRYQAIDYSRFLVHFTKNTYPDAFGPLSVPADHQLASYRTTSAIEKLIAIIKGRVLMTSPRVEDHLNSEAACFTETVLGSFRNLTANFSEFGLGFSKRFVFNRGGGPALYTRGDIITSPDHSIPDSMRPFIKPFDPDGAWLEDISNFLFEREWRIPNNLEFSYSDVEFVLVDTTENAEKLLDILDHPLGIARSKLIVMSSHRLVQEKWGIDS